MIYIAHRGLFQGPDKEKENPNRDMRLHPTAARVGKNTDNCQDQKHLLSRFHIQREKRM